MTEDVSDAATGVTPGDGDDAVRDAGASGPEAGTGGADASDAPAAPTAEPAVDYKDRWLRTEAELQTFRRRAAREREEAVQRAQESVLLETITALDDLERALAALGPERAAEPLAQGVALVAQRLRDTLARWDVSEVAALGQPFDPNVHEAMLEIDAPAGVAPGSVAQVVQKGYRRGDRSLRAARVVVARAGQDGQ